MGELRESVQRAFAEFLERRLYIIKAVIDVEKERCVLQVELDDGLVKLLPRSTMPLNFTTRKISDTDWIYRLSKYFDAWLVSIALKCVGHDDRKLLVKEIKKRASICEVISAVGKMKSLVEYGRPGDNECYICGGFASSVYWNWCGTCKDDEVWQYCNSCESYYNKCRSCLSDFKEVVRCSDKFCYCYCC